MFLRDAQRLEDCRKHTNLCPLGSGPVAGATLPLDRAAMAAALGFDAPTANSIDATSDRDFILEFVNALAVLALHWSRFAEEMILFSTQEFGFVQLPEAFSTGSSAMPQKKNPDLLELMRGKAARITGQANALMIAVKGLPLAYNKDLQETQEPLFGATETALAVLPMAAGFTRGVEFDFARMEQAAKTGFLNAWAAATYLVRQGVPFRLAHEQTGKAVQLCLEKNCELENLSLAELQSINPAFGHDFQAALTIQSVLELHDVQGGTAHTRRRQAISPSRPKAASFTDAGRV